MLIDCTKSIMGSQAKRSSAKYERRKVRKAAAKGLKDLPAKRCMAKRANGEQCKTYRMIVEIDGKPMLARTCYAHLPDSVAKRAGILTLAQQAEKAKAEGKKGGRPPTKPHAVLKKMVEEDVLKWLKPYVDALEATKPVVVGNGPTARVEMLPDDRARMQAAAEVMDRVWGKPKQTTETHVDLTGGIDVDIPSAPPTDKEREAEVARILADSGALGATVIAAQTQRQN